MAQNCTQAHCTSTRDPPVAFILTKTMRENHPATAQPNVQATPLFLTLSNILKSERTIGQPNIKNAQRSGDQEWSADMRGKKPQQ